MLADWRTWNFQDRGILFGSTPQHLCQACFLFIQAYFLPSPTSPTTGHIWSQLLCYWYMTLEQIPPSLEDVLTYHMVYVWWAPAHFNTNIKDVPDSYSCKPVGQSEGHSFLEKCFDNNMAYAWNFSASLELLVLRVSVMRSK